MYIPNGSLDTLFRKVHQVQEELRAYIIGGDNPVADVKNVALCIQNMYGHTISKFIVPHSTKHVDSFLLRYQRHADILISSSLSPIDQRFAEAKELCHILLDEHEDWSPKGVNTIATLIQDGELEISTGGEHTPGKFCKWENLALIAATELLYPFHALEADRQDLANKNTNFEKISDKRQIPVRCVKLVHNEHNYKELKASRTRALNLKNCAA